jgi:hypothetical protein
MKTTTTYSRAILAGVLGMPLALGTSPAAAASCPSGAR